ncbi:hypothetical protein GALMADRAFT_217423 [Galerina marginata CBS 339.88]|uniref:Uncharacterized protein n=1 Tax=Galerina marginata (strain CBS 339.88) TaxID=685588 RepID=A0A067SDB0_GALM3|nr:hypothetical protein GALMADRAFT_217423 [Galerina marginata CBS 339.88]
MDANAKNPYRILLLKLTGVGVQRPRQRSAANTWRKTKREAIKAESQRRAKKTSTSGKQLTALRDKVARDMFAKLSKEERAQWEIQAKEDHVEVLKKWNDDISGAPSTAPADRQDCIQGLPAFIQPILDLICKATGWKCSLIAGGPEPAHAGLLNIISVHSGLCSGDIKMNFGRAEHARYKKHIVPIFGSFLQSCYTPEECRSRALPMENDMDSLEAMGMDDDVNFDSVDSATTLALVPSASGTPQPPNPPTADPTRHTTPTSTVLPCPGLPSTHNTTSPPPSPAHSQIGSPPPPSPRHSQIGSPPPLSPHHSQISSPLPPSPRHSQVGSSPPPSPRHLQVGSPLPPSPRHSQVGSPPPAHSPVGSCTLPAHSQGDTPPLPCLFPTPGPPPPPRPAPAPTPPPAASSAKTQPAKRQDAGAASRKRGLETVPSAEEITVPPKRPRLRNTASESASTTAAMSSSVPQWFADAVEMLQSEGLGGSWAELVQVWSAFEAGQGYEGVGNLKAKYRPAAVGQWISRARPGSWRPVIDDLPGYEKAFNKWWYYIQPQWRQSHNDRVINKVAGDLDSLRKPGVNGLFSVLAALFFWGLALEKAGTRDRKRWRDAVADCHAVIRCENVNWVNFDNV